MRAKASSRDVSPFSRGALRSFARTLLENASDKIQPQARAARGRPSTLSSRADKDRRTRSHPAVPGPKFLPLREDSAARGIALPATQEGNEWCKHANARLLSASSSRQEQSEHVCPGARAGRCNRSSREDIASRLHLPANRTG